MGVIRAEDTEVQFHLAMTAFRGDEKQARAFLNAYGITRHTKGSSREWTKEDRNAFRQRMGMPPKN